jgi:hypothetical protein
MKRKHLKKLITIEDVPCYQCICLAVCRHRDLIHLERDCPLIMKYYHKKSKTGSNGLDYRKWSLLIDVLKMKHLKGDQDD